MEFSGVFGFWNLTLFLKRNLIDFWFYLIFWVILVFSFLFKVFRWVVWMVFSDYVIIFWRCFLFLFWIWILKLMYVWFIWCWVLLLKVTFFFLRRLRFGFFLRGRGRRGMILLIIFFTIFTWSVFRRIFWERRSGWRFLNIFFRKLLVWFLK